MNLMAIKAIEWDAMQDFYEIINQHLRDKEDCRNGIPQLLCCRID